MKNLVFFLMFLAVVGCRTTNEVVRDSVRVEYRERIEYQIDTQTIEIEKEVYKVITKDTSSYLSTSYAESYAKVSDGMLLHTLKNKNKKIEIPRETQIIYRDSIVYKDREVVREVIKRESWWVRYRGYIIILSIIIIYYLIRYYIIRYKI